MDTPSAPAHLSPERRALFERIASEYQLEAHHYELLRLACESLDRAEQARAVLAEEGCFVVDRYGGRRAHPGVAVERDAKTLAARLLRELNLEGEPAESDSRPPRR